MTIDPFLTIANTMTLGEGTVVGALVAAVGGLASAVSYLWKSSAARMSEQEKRLTTKLDQCEEKHERANSQLMDITEKVGKLEGRVEGREEVIRVVEEKIGRLEKSVLAAVAEGGKTPPNAGESHL